jgi:hypothetical protein
MEHKYVMRQGSMGEQSTHTSFRHPDNGKASWLAGDGKVGWLAGKDMWLAG